MTTCQPSNLTLSAGASAHASNQFIQSLSFTNRGHSTCVLGGWPGVQIVNAAGQKVPTDAERVRYNQPPAPAWKTVTLRPGGSASFSVSGQGFNVVSNQACPMSSAILVIPPNTTQQLRVDLKQAVCFKTYKVAPVIAGSRDLQPIT